MVEVKRDEDTYLQAEEQMMGNMQWVTVFEHGSSSDDFGGYLVLGQKVVVFRRDPNEEAAVPVVLREVSMLDDNDPFTRELSC